MKALILVFIIAAVAADTKFFQKRKNAPFGDCPVADTENVVYLMDINDRTVFYVCSAGKPIKQSCPPGLLFNPNLKTCDYPSRTCEPYGPVGTCNGMTFLRYLRDGANISVFYVCNGKKAIKYECADGKVYSTQLKVCVDIV